MEQTECSETLAYKLQTPWNQQKESIQQNGMKSIKLVADRITFVLVGYRMPIFRRPSHPTDSNTPMTVLKFGQSSSTSLKFTTVKQRIKQKSSCDAYA
jgi:hypothetical protein